MNRDDPPRSDPDRLLAARSAASDLVDATGNATDLGLAGFVGRRALRVVVGGRGRLVALGAGPLPPERLDAIRPGSAPMPAADGSASLGGGAAGRVE